MLVGITGPTCSGKSLLCSELQRRFAPRKVVVIHQDDFYKVNMLLVFCCVDKQ